MAAVWAVLGGLAGLLRMAAAGAAVALALIVYFNWFVIPDREDAARSGYVLLSRATTAESTAAELARQIAGQKVVIDAYQVQYMNSIARLEQSDADAEARIAEHEAQSNAAGVDDSLTVDQYNFIVRQRQSRKPANSGR
jgi:uncharacterized coiled-coil protein SlyX